MDNLTLEALVRELKPQLLQKKIQKVKMAGSQVLVLVLRSTSTEQLVISLAWAQPLLFLSSQELDSCSLKPDWLLLLRKELAGGCITGVRKGLAERVIYIDVENYHQAHQAEKRTLVLELIPAKPNLLLLDDQAQILASSRLWQSAGSGRAMSYQPPMLPSGPTCDQISKGEFLELIEASASTSPSVAKEGHSGLKGIAGMSPLYLREVCFEAHGNDETCWQRFQLLMNRITSGPYSPRVYCLPPASSSASSAGARAGKGRRVLLPFEFDSMRDFSCEGFLSLNAACDALFQGGWAELGFDEERRALLAAVQRALKKKKQLVRNLESDRARFEAASCCKKYADLLYAQPGRPPAGQSALRVSDLFDPEQREIEIPLDPRLSLIQNANQFNRLFQKSKRALPQISRRLEALKAEVLRLESKQQQLEAAKEAGDLQGHTLSSSGNEKVLPAPAKTKSQQKARPSKAGVDPAELQRKVAKSYLSSEGMTILVGKSSKDNDLLTTKIARSEDFWLHVAGVGGSHVVLKNPAKLAVPPQASLLEAAQLAAYFSQARNAPKVEVHYSQKKHVSKPKGAKSGLVTLRQFKSVRVRPELPAGMGGGEGER